MIYKNCFEIQRAQTGDVAVVARDLREIFERILIQRTKRPAFESFVRPSGKFLASLARHLLMLSPRSNGVNAASRKQSEFARTKRADPKAATAVIHRHLGKSRRRQSRKHRGRSKGHKCALDVPYPVRPSVLNFKRQEHSAGPKHAPNFSKSAILLLVRPQMMKHKNRNRRGKCFIRKRQRCRIRLNRGRFRAIRSRSELSGERVVILQTRHSPRETRQFFRCRAHACADFQYMLAQLRTLHNPRQELPARQPAPEACSTKPCFVCIHSSRLPMRSFRIRIRRGSTTMMAPFVNASRTSSLFNATVSNANSTRGLPELRRNR